MQTTAPAKTDDFSDLPVIAPTIRSVILENLFSAAPYSIIYRCSFIMRGDIKIRRRKNAIRASYLRGRAV